MAQVGEAIREVQDVNRAVAREVVVVDERDPRSRRGRRLRRRSVTPEP
jgi:hypothetical protein